MAGRGRKPKSRVYWRYQGTNGRAYGDFRDFSDVGGGREALIPRGALLATTDPVIAQTLASDRLAELQERRRNKTLLGVEQQASLAEFAAHHLVQKKKAGRVTDRHLADTEQRLRVALEFFGGGRDLCSISVQDVQRWVDVLAGRSGFRGESVSGGTIRHYLNALSNLYRRAQSEGYVQPGYNPVAALLEKPTGKRSEARWLEVHEAALLLEVARTYQPPVDQLAFPHVYPLLATFLLTGGRRSEVLGLEVEDVSLDRKTVTFRPNTWRRLKTRTSHRSVPLWPQLEEILREYMFGGPSPLVSGLLFPSERLGSPAVIQDTRKMLDAIAARAQCAPGSIRTKMFRHTYCAARLQTLDRGAPVSAWTVAREMGHGGRSLVDRVYGHLGEVRHRSNGVEFRVEQHQERLGERLALLKSSEDPARDRPSPSILDR